MALGSDAFRANVLYEATAAGTFTPWTFTVSNTSLFKAVINWGDGTTDTYTSNSGISHAYAAAGEYNVTLNVIGINRVVFTNVSNFRLTTINSLSGNNITNAASMFSTNMYLTTVVSGLRLPNCLSASQIFRNCTRLASLPENLFSGCPSLAILSNAFQACAALVNIPESIFSGCKDVVNFQNVFSDCSALENVPANLFRDCTKAANFNSAFSACRSLVSIPGTLFETTEAVTDFTGLFTGCSGLTTIESPELLFLHTAKATTFQNCFNGCTSLASDISSLYTNVPLATNFTNCHQNNSSITGNVPELWNVPTITQYTNCFLGCVNAANYASIPTGWK